MLFRGEAVSGWATGPVRAGAHPGDQVGNDRFLQFLFGRHFDFRMRLLNDLDKQTFFRLTWNNGGSGFASAQECFAGIDFEVVAGFFAAMTFKTGAGENRPDASFKKSIGLKIGFAVGLSVEREVKGQEKQKQDEPLLF